MPQRQTIGIGGVNILYLGAAYLSEIPVRKEIKIPVINFRIITLCKLIVCPLHARKEIIQTSPLEEGNQNQLLKQYIYI